MSENNQNLERILIKIGEKKQNNQIPGLTNIHPIYEALAALLRKNMSEQDLYNIFVRDENSLRKILAAEALLDNVKSQNKQQLIDLLKSGASLHDLVNRAALDIAEDKRTRDGKVLLNMPREAYDSFFYMPALAIFSNPRNIYAERENIDSVLKKYKSLRKFTLISILSSLALVSGLVIGSYFLGKHHEKTEYESINSKKPAVVEKMDDGKTNSNYKTSLKSYNRE